MRHSPIKKPHVSAFRLTRHHLGTRTPMNLIRVCQDVCGIQAQLMSAAEMALWARMHHLTRAEIHAALWQKRTLVKTSCMRQTLHLIPTGDFPIYITALKSSRIKAVRRIMSRFDVTPKAAEALNQTVVDALSDGPLTQRELTKRIKPRVGKNMKTYMDRVWSIQVFRAALIEGLICYGPTQGNQPTFVRVDHWLPAQSEVDERQAQHVLLRSYLSAFGPATLRDFCKWSGISTREAREVWMSIADDLLGVDIEGKEMFVLREDLEPLTNSKVGAHALRLLPYFDSYLLGHSDKDHLVDPAFYKRVYRNQGWISPGILLNGKVIGTWSYTRNGKKFSVQIEPFQRLAERLRTRIEEETNSLASFLEVSGVEIKYA